MSKKPYILWFDEVDKEDIARVGGKGANLGEMTHARIPVPFGFIVTSSAYYYFIKENQLEKHIRAALAHVDPNNPTALNHASETIKKIVRNASLPQPLAVEILKAYHGLNLHESKTAQGKKKSFGRRLEGLLEEPLVAVRSSATAEDLPDASFAGQQATFLNVEGDVDLLDRVKDCYGSLFEARAIFYRHEKAFDHFKVGIAVPVQKMVQAQASGVMFTIDPVTNDKHTITIEAIYGLGEFIVQGTVTPDHYEIDKKTLAINKKHLAKQDIKLIKSGKTTKQVRVKPSLSEKQKISDKLIEEIAALGKKIEHHYFFPQDIEWAVEDGRVYIVQTRPITTIRNQESGIRNQESKTIIHNSRFLIAILKGDPASPGIGCGPVKIIHDAKDIAKIKPGDVLVAPKTNPDYVPAMRKARAIVTDQGGRTSHAAIVSRELGIPAVVGTLNATKKLKAGMVITVNGTTGEVFKGGHITQISNFSRQLLRDPAAAGQFPISNENKPQEHLETKTKLYVNLAEPERAAEVAKLDVDGVGLLRAEFMIAEFGIHPLKAIKDKKQAMFIDRLAGNLKIFCEQFLPRPVVYRLSDFKTNEYRNLKGGAEFEPQEENPMLGFRGAYRFRIHPEMLKLEIDAVKKVREEMNLKNLWLMVPYVRTVAELIEIKQLITSFGLHRNASFQFWMMVEIPSNVILIDEFIAAGIDGVSIGSNDLTMLTLGTDRDNSELTGVFSERNEAVVLSFEKVIKACHKHGITSSICGQAPSTYPDLVDKLVDFGITSISINIDAAVSTRETIYKAEKKLWQK